MVFPNSHRLILPVSDEEDNTKCVPIGLFVLVLLSGRHQDDSTACHFDAGILANRQRDLPLHEPEKRTESEFIDHHRGDYRHWSIVLL